MMAIKRCMKNDPRKKVEADEYSSVSWSDGCGYVVRGDQNDKITTPLWAGRRLAARRYIQASVVERRLPDNIPVFASLLARPLYRPRPTQPLEAHRSS